MKKKKNVIRQMHIIYVCITKILKIEAYKIKINLYIYLHYLFQRSRYFL